VKVVGEVEADGHGDHDGQEEHIVHPLLLATALGVSKGKTGSWPTFM
jgi:hypothetical protein